MSNKLIYKISLTNHKYNNFYIPNKCNNMLNSFDMLIHVTFVTSINSGPSHDDHMAALDSISKSSLLGNLC